MQVLSPVGRFPVTVDGVHIQDRRIVVKASLGAWRSEVTLERSDLPLVSVVLAVLGVVPLATFGIGRWSTSSKRTK